MKLTSPKFFTQDKFKSLKKREKARRLSFEYSADELIELIKTNCLKFTDKNHISHAKVEHFLESIDLTLLNDYNYGECFLGLTKCHCPISDKEKCEECKNYHERNTSDGIIRECEILGNFDKFYDNLLKRS